MNNSWQKTIEKDINTSIRLLAKNRYLEDLDEKNPSFSIALCNSMKSFCNFDSRRVFNLEIILTLI